MGATSASSLVCNVLPHSLDCLCSSEQPDCTCCGFLVMLVGPVANVFKPTDCIQFDQDKLAKTAAEEAVDVLWAVSRSTLIKDALVQLFKHLLYRLKLVLK